MLPPLTTTAAQQVTITGCTAPKCVEQVQYRGRFTPAGSSLLDIRRLSLRGLRAARNGGAIDVGRAAAVSATDTEFKDNSAVFGGAICATCYSCSITLARCSFKNNYAASGGGAIECFASLLMTSVLFEFNAAGISGGAVEVFRSKVKGSGRVRCTGCRFVGNKAHTVRHPQPRICITLHSEF